MKFSDFVPWALFAAAVPLTVSGNDLVSWVEQRESGGRNIAGKHGERGTMQIRSIAWRETTAYRRKLGQVTWDYSQAWVPARARIYGKSFLDLQTERLRKHLKREPSWLEIHQAYRYGFAGFKKLAKKGTK